MPELPEVETVRIQLSAAVVGQEISGVEVFHAKTVAHDDAIEDRLVGKTIAAVDRVGKLLIFSFVDEADLYILAHLKMTGQFFYIQADGDITGGGHSMTGELAEFPNAHTRSAFYFTDGSALYFNDMRLFGYTKLATAAEVETARAGFGPEPIDPDFDCEWFSATLRKKKTPVKAALLNQSFVAGLGNIYVDEALWRAKVRPTRRADRVRKAEAAALCAAAGDVMSESIAVGGTTFQHFKDTGGQNGNFTDYLQVFGQQGQACSRCGEMIKKIRCAGRGTHYCPGCQR
ncbi:bifunctional DNA-formamidopyrimidine glycosylase/DNA-(apurinic or apyrimidinic site) lyase [Candidatus Pacebacteria bacterium]|nr:bifunctional DNA-formamidopyrimidine glycosylase/DNA-(apurinic or apyrimidinic site) lyase [Candidatus Paceibacterota bacterium]